MRERCCNTCRHTRANLQGPSPSPSKAPSLSKAACGKQHQGRLPCPVCPAPGTWLLVVGASPSRFLFARLVEIFMTQQASATLPSQMPGWRFAHHGICDIYRERPCVIDLILPHRVRLTYVWSVADLLTRGSQYSNISPLLPVNNSEEFANMKATTFSSAYRSLRAIDEILAVAFPAVPSAFLSESGAWHLRLQGEVRAQHSAAWLDRLRLRMPKSSCIIAGAVVDGASASRSLNDPIFNHALSGVAAERGCAFLNLTAACTLSLVGREFACDQPNRSMASLPSTCCQEPHCNRGREYRHCTSYGRTSCLYQHVCDSIHAYGDAATLAARALLSLVCPSPSRAAFSASNTQASC